MKITERISGLVLELGKHESFESLDRLIVRNELSLKNMLSLFCETDNDSTKILINKILNEAGFAWFDKANPVEVKQSLEDALLEESQRDLQDDLTEIDLMRMLPVNNHLH